MSVENHSLMLTIDGEQLEMYSIIELCVLPDMRVHDMMIELSRQVEHPIFIDTIGNLRFMTNSLYILSYKTFIKTLLSLRSRHGFVLFIDSISFIADRPEAHPQKIYNILWRLVYENNATIVVSNHYKVLNSTYTPRMEFKWMMMVSYRVMFRYVGSETSMKVVRSEMFEMRNRMACIGQ